ncbi:MAG TPA: TetR/AcrR family transcriptional regulator [Candidatus Binatia bacterium]|nr:TetR/AcrR family transcriptional regulator [Candidatus Binatia bacterium]
MEASGRTNKRVAQGQRSRGRLLRAATRRFAERGYSATSVDDVCRDAGVVKTALYWHFDSKEGLLAAVLEETATAWIQGVVDTVFQTGDPRERLRRAIDGMRDLIENRPALLRILHAMTLERTRVSRATRAVLLRVSDRARAALVDGLAEAIGTRPAGLEGVAAIVLAAVDGIFLQHQLRQDPAELDRLFAELERAIVFLVSTVVGEAHRAAASASRDEDGAQEKSKAEGEAS